MVERTLSMREAVGSMPTFSTFLFFVVVVSLRAAGSACLCLRRLVCTGPAGGRSHREKSWHVVVLVVKDKGSIEAESENMHNNNIIIVVEIQRGAASTRSSTRGNK